MVNVLEAICKGILDELKEHHRYRYILRVNHYRDMSQMDYGFTTRLVVATVKEPHDKLYLELYDECLDVMSRDRNSNYKPGASRNASFDYKDPAFPDNLYAYLEQSLCPPPKITV